MNSKTNSMTTLLRTTMPVAAAFALALPSQAAFGENWRTVTLKLGTTEQYLRDYVEGSGVATNARGLQVGGNWVNGLMHDVDFDSAGNEYAMASFNDNGIYKVNDVTGACNQIATIGGMPEGDLTYNPVNNRLYAAGTLAGTSTVFEIDLNNNNQVSTFCTGTGWDDISGLACDSLGNMYALATNANGNGIPDILKVTGSGFTNMGTLGVGSGVIAGMDYDIHDTLYVLTGSGALYTFSPTSPNNVNFVDFVANSDGQPYTGLAAVTPEPCSMIGLGAAALGFLARRRNKARA
ncbi:MAG: PEP-CTERM sorting domain-containing protein [Armatimonadetes bacterium]|nr:PEP-CTERM sorting domain-containing protein [Armatimonadota bacterium]